MSDSKCKHDWLTSGPESTGPCPECELERPNPLRALAAELRARRSQPTDQQLGYDVSRLEMIATTQHTTTLAKIIEKIEACDRSASTPQPEARSE